MFLGMLGLCGRDIANMPKQNVFFIHHTDFCVLSCFFFLIGTDDEDVVPAGLPERLFATDRFPCERINMYSTIDFLLCVRDALNGTEEMAMLLRSCFGTLFRFPVRRVLMGKVIHGMLTRQVLTKKGGFILLRSAFVLVMIA